MSYLLINNIYLTFLALLMLPSQDGGLFYKRRNTAELAYAITFLGAGCHGTLTKLDLG